jgi:hypothetical protein
MHGDLESLLFGLLFLAVVGYQLLKQFLAARAEQRRRQQQAQRASAYGQAGMPQPEPEPLELSESDWGRPPEPVTPASLPPARVPVPPAQPQAAPRVRDDAPARRTNADQQRRRVRHRLFHSRRALRHGIVMMTVLGPCRALKPYDHEQ